MPAITYEDLLTESLPARIDSPEQYSRQLERFSELMGNRRRTAPEQKLMHLLGVLIEDYDRRNALPPDRSSPSEMLAFLLEHSGKTAADLLPVFGQRSHVSEALNGKRKISAEQARKLGRIFHVQPGLFV